MRKTILITGASSGLGRALAVEASKAGYKQVVLAARNLEQLQETARLCQAHQCYPHVVECDVTVEFDCKHLIDEAIRVMGRIDHMVLNAGRSMWSDFSDLESLEVFKNLMDVNFYGALNCIHHGLPHLKKSKALITSVLSVQARIGVPKHSAYVASKHALHGFLETLKAEESDSLDFLMVYPGWVKDTKLRSNALDKAGNPLKDGHARNESREALTSDKCAKAILKSMEKRDSELYMPIKYRVASLIRELSPRLLSAIVTRRMKTQHT
jgi:NAD(P)-dependent dehydrogenase (short-subunit alcohol dehydrogenase family)